MTPDQARDARTHLAGIAAYLDHDRLNRVTTTALGVLEVMVKHWRWRLLLTGTPDGEFRYHITTEEGREFTIEDWSLIDATNSLGDDVLCDEIKRRREELIADGLSLGESGDLYRDYNEGDMSDDEL